MGALDWLAGRLGYVKPAAGGQRAQYGYAASQLSRLTSSLQSETQFINTSLRFQLRILRARARQAAQNNPFARRFVQMCVDNIAGAEPFKLQGKVRNRSGDLNAAVNRQIEDVWRDWGKAGNCDITGKWSWNALQRLLVRNLAIDGELLIRKLTGPEYGAHGFKLQVIDVDRLWEYNTKALDNGGAIHASVEVDANARPVAYHILKRKPAQWQYSGYTLEMDRVPAEEIIHIFVPDFAEQVRGVPWMYAALLNLVHLGAFEEAAVIAARVGAANMGFIETPDGGATLADQAGAGPNKDGSNGLGGNSATPGDPQFSAEPGEMLMLPPGYKFNSGWNPKYPDAAVEPFIKAMLRGVACGVGVSYHNLANDLEGVNYSSARIGELDERDMWTGLQTFVAEHLHAPLYDEWMPMQLLTGTLPLAPFNLDKYRDVRWRARRWAWVDPLKEVGAAIEAVDAKLKSRTQVIAEMGGERDEVWEELQQENEDAEEMGIDLGPVAPKTTGVVNEPGVQPGDSGDDGAPAQDGKSRFNLSVTAPLTVAVPESVKHDVRHHVKIEGMDELAAELGTVAPAVGEVLDELRLAAKRPVSVARLQDLLDHVDEALRQTRASSDEMREAHARLSREVAQLARVAAARRILITDNEGNPVGSEPVLEATH